MPASEAQITANRANSARSTGPKTAEGKERSRANSYKHGLTGSGMVLPEREAAEVKRRYARFVAELNPSGEVGLSLVLLAATMSVRLERCVGYENAMLTARVRQALADYEVPEGLDEAEIVRLRAEVSERAMFDTSKEAILARKYEAATERSFLRALKELRAVEKQAKATEDEMFGDESASSLPDDMTDEEFDRLYAQTRAANPPKPSKPVETTQSTKPRGEVDVPLTIGRRR